MDLESIPSEETEEKPSNLRDSGSDYLICANCEIEIQGLAVFREGKPFCCVGCAEGGPCLC